MQIALAPMEGLVDNILRDVLTRVGGIDWCVTEFIRVCDRLLPASSFDKLAPELRQGARTAAGVPMRVQLLGSDPSRAVVRYCSKSRSCCTPLCVKCGGRCRRISR